MIDHSDSPIRILHVIGTMDRGGLEVWLMHMLRQIDRRRFRMDFLASGPGEFDEEICALDSQVHYCAPPSRLFAFRRSLRSILREQGPYDVVHSHLHQFSGLVLQCAARAGVPHRIAHSHNDESAAPWKISLKRRTYLKLMQTLIQRHATRGLACSVSAAVDLFGREWSQDSRWDVHLYSMPFAESEAREADIARLREQLGMPRDAFVIGHVGRFAEQKNHSFLIDVIAAALQHRPDLWLLLVGAGALRPDVERKASRLGMADRVIFAGLRNDVPALMHAMDGFLFPSFHEGCGLALVEAQAAGLPCVVADTLPDEAIVVRELVARRALTDPIDLWVSSVLAMPDTARRISRPAAFQRVTDSAFHLDRGVAELESMYLSECGRSPSTRMPPGSTSMAGVTPNRLVELPVPR